MRATDGDLLARRRTALVHAIETRCRLSTRAAMLLIELDAWGELSIEDESDFGAVEELRRRGLAEVRAPLAYDADSRVRAVPAPSTPELLRHIRALIALDEESARVRAHTSDPDVLASHASGTRRSTQRKSSESKTSLSPEFVQAITDDALAMVQAAPVLPAANDVRIYMRPGPRFVRVFWAYRGQDDNGSILHFVEIKTGRVFRAKSSRQVGAPTSRFINAARAAGGAR